jgi:hypothetical protein
MPQCVPAPSCAARAKLPSRQTQTPAIGTCHGGKRTKRGTRVTILECQGGHGVCMAMLQIYARTTQVIRTCHGGVEVNCKNLTANCCQRATRCEEICTHRQVNAAVMCAWPVALLFWLLGAGACMDMAGATHKQHTTMTPHSTAATSLAYSMSVVARILRRFHQCKRNDVTSPGNRYLPKKKKFEWRRKQKMKSESLPVCSKKRVSAYGQTHIFDRRQHVVCLQCKVHFSKQTIPKQ